VIQQSKDFLFSLLPMGFPFVTVRDMEPFDPTAFHPTSHISLSKLQFVLRHMRASAAGKGTAGIIVEVGIYKGGTLNEMAARLPWQRFIGYDTFEGLPAPTYYDQQTVNPHNQGDFNDSDFQRLSDFFSNKGIGIVRCRFPHDVPDQAISFAHLDVDLWHDTLESLKYLERNLVLGGRVVVDDYGWIQTPGVKTAVDAFLDNPLSRLVAVENSGEYQIALEVVR
jgi:O-methyltransferase